MKRNRLRNAAQLVLVLTAVCLAAALGVCTGKRKEILKSRSPDGRFTLTVYDEGTMESPYGPSLILCQLREGRRLRAQKGIRMNNGGLRADAGQFGVEWTEDAALLAVRGGEQGDRISELVFPSVLKISGS